MWFFGGYCSSTREFDRKVCFIQALIKLCGFISAILL